MKIAEATLLMPLTCLIIIAVMGLMMEFYSELDRQISDNAVRRDKIYEVREVTVIRIRDRMSYEKDY